MTDDRTSASRPVLTLEVGRSYVAVPVASVVETMRPLHVEPIPGLPRYVRGLSIIRGHATPVVDTGLLLGKDDGTAPGRFVTLRHGTRLLALAASRVVGLRRLSAEIWGALGSLDQQVEAGVVEGIGVLDEALLVVLRASRLVPEAVWGAIDAAATPEAR